MENVLDTKFNKAFAIAWSENQGGYSETIAKKTLSFIKNQGLRVNTVLDIFCGSANFLSEMQKNKMTCTGTEILDSFIDYNKAKYPDIKFIKTTGLLDFEGLETYDLISCNHDVVNYLESLEQWGQFFKQVYRHLNNGGIFIFDYFTKRRLQDWNEVIYNENEKLDYIRSINATDENKTIISDVYYINLNPTANENLDEKVYTLTNENNKYRKTENIKTEYYFENDEILNEIKKAGYRYLITTDANFAPVSGISDMNRIHVIAIKREAVQSAAPQPQTQAQTQTQQASQG